MKDVENDDQNKQTNMGAISVSATTIAIILYIESSSRL